MAGRGTAGYLRQHGFNVDGNSPDFIKSKNEIRTSYPKVDGAFMDEIMPIVARVALAAVDTAGGVFSFQNPHAEPILVTKLILDVTTESTGACTLDCGPAANATTLNDTLIDAANVATAGVFDNIDDQGTNGLATVKVAENGGAADFVTGSVASGASAGIVGFAYIEYIKLRR